MVNRIISFNWIKKKYFVRFYITFITMKALNSDCYILPYCITLRSIRNSDHVQQ